MNEKIQPDSGVIARDRNIMVRCGCGTCRNECGFFKAFGILAFLAKLNGVHGLCTIPITNGEQVRFVDISSGQIFELAKNAIITCGARKCEDKKM